ncbi:Protein of unknown function [Flavobacterium indicum GPTSA100-9 = DSM 17447]|uniref:YdhG-like domain-containing protein n=1 Tax=Flavobacterium indicum (strain DSM 17447 / CIP 109464 / GPTSA100-9) TaxID=1094466 RepID=H8XSY5_FLAIG|nr:DUF1801 domain-containing protein [Flavobacterium indicum]CCG53527.1 Protein of unknown function [Flavobacterium indicum GPTSA100-9 = DSM 17447]
MKPSEVYILRQSSAFQEIIFYVISVIEQEIEGVELLFKWGIPYFYYHKKPFIYIAPNKTKGFVDVGFARGFQLHLHQSILIDENRNTVKSLRYFNIDSVDDSVLRDLIQEAKLLYKKIA